MATSKGIRSPSMNPLYGTAWQSKLYYFAYDENLKADHPSVYGPSMFVRCRSNIPTDSQVKKISLLQIDLDGVPGVADVLSHDYLEFETEDGHVFTLEKDKVCILMQSCPKTLELRQYRGGEKRKKRKSIRVTKTWTDCDFKMEEVLFCIFKKNLLMEHYDIHSANCKHFAHYLWVEFTLAKEGTWLVALMLMLQ